MSVRKQVLDALTRARLKQIASKLGRDYAVSAKKGDVVNSLNRTRSIHLADILGQMLRQELKLACTALEIDDSGREKKRLISRILAAERFSQREKLKGWPAVRRKADRKSSTVSRSSGKSNFLNGVGSMDDPKVINGGPDAGRDENADVQRVELVWPGKKRQVDRVVLPFQRIETVNESRATREAERGTLFRGQTRDAATSSAQTWRNSLIWGDNKYILGSLIAKFAGQVDLIYIDPPFATGQDFTLKVNVGEQSFEKEPSLLEEKAYRDTWGKGLQSYLAMMHDRLCLMRELLSSKGTIYVHCDWHVGHYLKIMLDDLFGSENFVNEICWHYFGFKRKTAKNFPRKHDTILVFSKTSDRHWEVQYKPHRPEYVARFKKDKDGRLYRDDVNPTGGGTRLIYLDEVPGDIVDSVWDDIPPVNPVASERWDYATQKPEALLERIIKASSEEGSIVADFFCGSGTTGTVAEKLNRRWIMADLSRWAIQTSRKRLLETEGCRPFEVLNLGKYERQYWQGATFGEGQQKALHEYFKFILDLYQAEPVSGFVHLHGQSAGYMVHIGAADAPITLAEIRDAIDECKKIDQNRLDILGWEWEMGLHDVVEAESQRSGVKLRLLQIPRECMDKRAADAGDVHFYELAYLEVLPETKGKSLRLKLKNFVIPNPELIPDEVRKKVKKWSDFIDYWAVDFDFKDDTFHNQWQDYRTRAKRDLVLVTDWHEFEKRGQYRVLVKVFDIFGNDTTHLMEVLI